MQFPIVKMNNALRNIAELCHHEYLRERRSMHFKRNVIIWSLKIVLWTSMALALPRTLETAGISIGESLPLLLLTDQIIRWFSQNTPAFNAQQYRLMPIRNWHVLAAYLLRMLLMPINFIWLPAVWPQWWLLGWFLLSGYVYLACWHTYLHLTKGKESRHRLPQFLDNGAFLSCELKLRFRHPILRQKIRNGMVVSIMLTLVSMALDTKAYTDFTILYTLTFPTLPLLTARLGYEQAYMPLLHTRLHGLRAVYRAKYMAALLMLLPGIIILLLPVAMGTLQWQRLAGLTMAVALLIYPTVLTCAPRSEIGSPTAQIVTLATLALPTAIAQAIG